MNKITPVTNEIYHIYNRGVEKRKVFMNELDYFRFIHDLYEFNDVNPPPNINYFSKQSSYNKYLEGYLPNIRPQRELIIEIMAFCLMPNHFHILARQKIDGGISKFMLKLGTGYTNYFNEKYERVGSLFQGSYKLTLIKNESHFIYLPYYIHLNPLDLVSPEWRDKKINNLNQSLNFLENYRWSSYLDYIGKKNFPSVTQRKFILKFFNGTENYKEGLKNWLNEMDIENMSHILLE